MSASEYLPYDVERLLAKLVQKELKLARESERLKQELAARYDFNLDALFKDIDDININYVDAPNLKRFLIKSGVFANEQLLIAILRRFDLDADAKLNKKEFTEGITPILQDFSKRQLKDNKTTQLSTSRILSPGKSQRSTVRSSSKKTLNKSKSAIKD